MDAVTMANASCPDALSLKARTGVAARMIVRRRKAIGKVRNFVRRDHQKYGIGRACISQLSHRESATPNAPRLAKKSEVRLGARIKCLRWCAISRARRSGLCEAIVTRQARCARTGRKRNRAADQADHKANADGWQKTCAGNKFEIVLAKNASNATGSRIQTRKPECRQGTDQKSRDSYWDHLRLQGLTFHLAAENHE